MTDTRATILARIPGDPAAAERLCAAAVALVRLGDDDDGFCNESVAAQNELSAAIDAYAATVPSAGKRGKKGSV